MKNYIQQILNFLTPKNWCHGAWHRTYDGVSTLNNSAASQFCLIGAIGHVLEGKAASMTKRYLEDFLYTNAPNFLPELFVTIPPPPPGKPKPKPHRLDYSNLAKFNDEKSFPDVVRFLQAAAAAA